MVRDVAGVAERLALRGDQIDRVPDGVARCRHGLDAGQKLLAVADEHHALAVRQELLAGARDEILELRMRELASARASTAASPPMRWNSSRMSG